MHYSELRLYLSGAQASPAHFKHMQEKQRLLLFIEDALRHTTAAPLLLASLGTQGSAIFLRHGVDGVM